MLKCENISKIYNDNSWFSKKESIKVKSMNWNIVQMEH